MGGRARPGIIKFANGLVVVDLLKSYPELLPLVLETAITSCPIPMEPNFLRNIGMELLLRLDDASSKRRSVRGPQAGLVRRLEICESERRESCTQLELRSGTSRKALDLKLDPREGRPIRGITLN